MHAVVASSFQHPIELLASPVTVDKCRDMKAPAEQGDEGWHIVGSTNRDHGEPSVKSDFVAYCEEVAQSLEVDEITAALDSEVVTRSEEKVLAD